MAPNHAALKVQKYIIRTNIVTSCGAHKKTRFRFHVVFSFDPTSLARLRVILHVAHPHKVRLMCTDVFAHLVWPQQQPHIPIGEKKYAKKGKVVNTGQERGFKFAHCTDCSTASHDGEKGLAHRPSATRWP
jgi:hypothetical protein